MTSSAPIDYTLPQRTDDIASLRGGSGLRGALEAARSTASVTGNLAGVAAERPVSDLPGSTLSGSRLSGSRLSGSTLSGSTLSGSTLSPAQLADLRLQERWRQELSAQTAAIGAGAAEGENDLGQAGQGRGALARELAGEDSADGANSDVSSVDVFAVRCAVQCAAEQPAKPGDVEGFVPSGTRVGERSCHRIGPFRPGRSRAFCGNSLELWPGCPCFGR